MGVHGLWDLLAPVGRRVSVDTLAGKKLAIDASIWMIQFMKAMRDEKGEMVRNAHLLGFFRRICKLLFLRTKPVFVFDGGTPALKRRTVIARRRHRENAKAKIRKTAEKLLLNHLKSQRVEELAKEIKKQRENVDTVIKEIAPDKNTPSVEDSSERTADAVSSQVHVQGSKENLDAKGKQVMTDDDSSSAKIRSGCPDMRSEDLDELLAASLAAEENFSSAGPSTTAYGDHIEEESDEDEDEDEEMILPEMTGGLDPTVLAALPPSMQLDLLVQMRERLMAENRQKYQQVKKAPSKFSELQIQSYLRTVAFRREIDEVQKAAAARGVGGVQTSRIASEANREFIFSSSFSGDKQELSSSRIGRHRDDLSQGKKSISSDIIPSLLSTVGSRSLASTPLEEQTENSQDIGAYVDEFGRFRMSRVRGLGIRMTRDLQRNLDLMKEFERGKGKADADADKMEILGNLSDNSRFVQVEESEQDNDMTAEIETTPIFGNKDGSLRMDSLLGGGNTIQISFIDDGSVPAATDGNDIFAKLVADGLFTSAENFYNSSVEVPSGDDDDVDWEDGTCDVIGDASPCPNETKGITSLPEIEEEADIQEAIKRSLVELAEKKSQYNLTNDINMLEPAEPQDFVKEQMNLLDVPKSSGFSRSMESCDPLVDLEVIRNDDCSSLLEEVNLDIDGKSIRQSPDGSKVGLDSVTTKVIDTQEPSIASPKVISSAATETPSVCCDISGGEDCSIDPVIDKDITPSQQNVASEALKISLNVQDPLPSNSTDSELNPENLVLDSESIFVDLEKPFEDVVTLDDEMEYLKQEREFLGNEQKRHERDAEYVSSEMFAECQELLQMFGLPYIIAPMEAEAQCAFLEMTNMVDGVVTDDSDVFLFGARSVFKNIFDDRKYVETYLMKDIETDLGLSKEKLIRMALLLGSDYTEGVSGIGIVNAIEVVNAFPEDDGLQKFREWFESPDPAILGRLNTHSRKKSSKGNHVEADVPTQDDQSLSTESSGFTDAKTRDNISDDKRVFMDKHRNVSKNWHIPPSFPSEAVVTAYISPKVDESTERFSWGKPDLLVLRKLCWERFGWTDQKADQLLIPVLKEYDTHETQMRLEAFYTFNDKFAKIRSQRIKKAVKGITGKDSSNLVVEDMSPKSKSRKRLGGRTSKGQLGRPVDTSTRTNDPSQNNKRPSGRKQTQSDICDDHFSQREMASGSFSQKKSRQNSKRGRSQNPRGRGMGSKRRRKEKSSSDTTSSSSSDHELHLELENSKQNSVLRQSTRRRSQAKYMELDSDSDEGHEHGSKEAYSSSGQEAVDVAHQGLKGNASEEELVVQDYLRSGGGFCIDEDEPTTSQPVEADTNSTMDTELETGELKLSSEPEHSLDAKNPPAQGLVEFESEECLKSSSGGITAVPEVSLVDVSLKSIPNLRRKRRKI